MTWADENQAHLARELDRILALVGTAIPRFARDGAERARDDENGGHGEDASFAHLEDRSDEESLSFSPPAIDQLAALFNLSSFERDVLLLCAGIELDSRFLEALGQRPTFARALSVLPDAHWSSLSPDAPLRAWRLIELSGAGIANATIAIDERILHYLAGVSAVDARLRGTTTILAADPAGSVRHDELATTIARHIETNADTRLTQIIGSDASARLSMAASTCAILGNDALLVRSADILPSPIERFELARLLSREALLRGSLIVVDALDADAAAVSTFATLLEAPTIVATSEPITTLGPNVAAFTVPANTRAERLEIWKDALGARATDLNGTLARVSTQFELESSTIRAIASPVRSSDESTSVADAIWSAARAATRPRMDGLAERIEAVAGWDDIVVPEQQRRTLEAIAATVRQRHRVYDDMGFATKSSRGLGITALFAGPSGTGKTMAAEVLARDLNLDLYRIDLSSVVSKYIGETEKNLNRVFSAAEHGSAILLFDEADALFGKRSDVKDSHDRYANIEVSYLLQRMESYRGLAILTTNLKSALDPAFVRRLRFIVQFPFPDAEQRAAIWKTTFPSAIETSHFDWQKLAQLNVAGGQIRNIALASAFIAADRDEPISMKHLAEAARSEYAKTDRAPSDSEMRGWA
jgi:DNA polymerase III delta prime subunit